MKKIMFYIGSMQFGGAQRVMANLCDYFISKKYEVILINDLYPVKCKEEYEIDRRIKRYFIETQSKNKIEKNIKIILNLRRIIKLEQADVIISFTGSPNIRTLFATYGLKIKKIISVRNDPYKEYGRGIKKIISRIVLNRADGCVFQTRDAKKYFSRKLQKKSKIIFNPVNKNFYDVVRSSKIKDIVTVGRLEKQKNHKLLIDAYIKIHKKVENNKLIIYGEGSLRVDLEKYIKENNMCDYIILPGEVKNICKRLSKAKVFVLSSDYEGMPNALMEAMAVGVPIISTDCPCGGPKELINSNQGILVKCNDVNELSQKMDELIHDENLLNILSNASKKRALDFKSDTIFKEWEDYILNIIHNK